jgi:hypothetical protein
MEVGLQRSQKQGCSCGQSDRHWTSDEAASGPALTTSVPAALFGAHIIEKRLLHHVYDKDCSILTTLMASVIYVQLLYKLTYVRVCMQI